MSNGDPFYTVRDNVNSQVEKIKIRHETFLDYVKNSDTSTNIDFKEIRKDLQRDIRKAEKDLNGLKGAVDMVDKNRLKFPHIKDGELGSRKNFVDDMFDIINVVKSSIESAGVRRKMEDDENKAKNRGFDDASNALYKKPENEIEKDNNRFIGEQRQVTKQTINQQDVQLDSLGNAVDRLGMIGRDVNQELKEQNVMIDTLETDLDDAGNKMNVVMASLSKLLKTKDGCQIWTIVVLVLILCILVALIIWA
mmetsp:Transcript_27807/g.26625  ORF Transcript_27807/g.26625 Transcript_27807/m.26625 type:complete len:251 (+) Transcript_27807:127-879(+)